MTEPTDPIWRQRCDQLADGTIASLYAHQTLDEVNRILAAVTLNDQVPPDTLPPAIRSYFALSAVRPPWADEALIRAGQEVFAERGPLILLALVTCSLAECYALGNGVQVLHLTHRMDRRHVYRRVYETAQFIVDVCSPGGLEPQGRGLRATQKVRLMHSGVRHLLLAPPPPGVDPESTRFTDVLLGTSWDSAVLGLPINWQDQAFTLQSFGWVILRSLERFGCPCSAAERAAWLHLWAVAGWHLGIDEALLPRDEAAAVALYDGIRRDQERATPQGRALTRALGSFVSQKLESRFWGRAITTTLLRWLCDPETAALVGVRPLSPPERWATRLLKRLIDLIWNRHDRSLQRWLGLWLVDHLTRLPREWDRGLFAIPDHLLTRWRR